MRRYKECPKKSVNKSTTIFVIISGVECEHGTTITKTIIPSQYFLLGLLSKHCV